MKQYLKINEFARLRNININSLRYYEKLGLLIPAWIDPDTKYRYYLPEQLILLDMITLCIRLGIPLKNLKTYIDENGVMDEKKIFEDGHKIMQEKIMQMQLDYEMAHFNLQNLQENQKYSHISGIYRRQIEERHLIVKPYHGNWNNIIEKEKVVMELFRYAQSQSMAPVFPAGILINHSSSISYSFFFQVLHPADSKEEIIYLPKAEYSCLKADLTPETDILKLIEKEFGMTGEKHVIISNMLMNKLHFNSKQTEIQIPL